MADYYPVLKRAIGALQTNSGEARRAVYEKARAALVNQLKSYEPPLSQAEITDQRLQLEESIRRIESEVAGAAFGLPTVADAVAQTSVAVPAVRVDTRTAPEPATADAGAPRPETRPAVPRPPEPKPPAVAAPPPKPVAAPPPKPVAAPPPKAPPAAPSPPSPPPPAAVSPEPVRPAPPKPVAVKPAPVRADPPKPAVTDPKISAGLSSLSKTLHEAEALGGASAQAVRAARGAIEPEGEGKGGEGKVEPGFMDAPLGGDLPPRGAGADELAPAPAVRRPQRAERAAAAPRKGFNAPLAAAVLLLLVLGAGGAFAWLNRASLFGADDAATTAETPATAEPATAETSAAPADGLGPKIPDRLPQDGEPAEPVAPDARPVQTERVVPPATDPSLAAPQAPAVTPPAAEAPAAETPVAEAPAEPAPETPAAPPEAAAPPAVTPPPAASAEPPAANGAPVVLVAQRAILYEEPIPGSDGARSEGQVLWQFVSEPSLPGEAAVPQIRAVVDVPDRGIKLTMQIRKNGDSALPASHIVEMTFQVPSDFAGRSIDTTPGLIVKQTEDARGDPLIGAVAKVQDNLFWLALSGIDQDVQRNVALLREREWFDVPIRYGNRRRAILTFEKGAPGVEAFTKALAAWGQ